jgi:hypothetical protein
VDPEWKLRLFKAFLNVPFRLLDRLLKFPEPKYPQTRMLQNTYRIMLGTYRLEVAKGVFDVPDGNFERFLSVSAKLLANVAEQDRYYRAWLGLGYLLAEAEMSRLDLLPEDLVFEINRQWMDDLSFLPREHFELYKRDFTEVVLSSNLVNLARMVESSPLRPRQGGN